jgi:hypothetical protein
VIIKIYEWYAMLKERIPAAQRQVKVDGTRNVFAPSAQAPMAFWI